MREKPKFALHPGYITSINDGQQHYVGIRSLANLYELRDNEYIIWTENRGYKWEDYQHLYPDYYGRYGRPDDREG